MSFRISVDIGGTFTDLVMVDDQGDMSVFKSPTTRADYVQAVLNNLEQASNYHEVPIDRLLRECSPGLGGCFVHGSTISTNAMLESKVAKTGLIITRGFRDMLTHREAGKDEPYMWHLDFPEPYIPRYLTLPATERMNSEGEIEVPLNEEDVRTAIRQFREWNVQAIAVSCMWSIANPVHELRIGEIIQEEWPEIPYVLAHQVNPVIREYRRTSSAAINASLKPLVSKYISNFQEVLREKGLEGEMLLFTSSGGVINTKEVLEKPISTIDSGPALAPVSALWFAASERDRKDIIVVDMGGTSFDIICVTGGVIAISRESKVGPDMLGIDKVDTSAIGAGGGSVVWVDTGGLLHVGPESMGADPGPACYGKGGTHPTVTDANVVLGYIDPAYFLGGAVALDAKLAEQAIQQHVAAPLDLSLEDAAFNILSISNVNMVSGIEDITVWQGIDPREYLFVSGGGAAGCHIIPIAKELGAKEILIPKSASVLSAVGGVFGDVTTNFYASRFTDSNDFEYDAVNAKLEDLERQAEVFLQRAGIPQERRRIELYTEARYAYQAWELSVPLRGTRVVGEKELAELVQDFNDAHERVFAIKDPDQYLEFVNWKAKATGLMPKPKVRKVTLGTADASAAIKGKRKAYFQELGGMVDTPIYSGEAMKANNRIEAPAVIEEPTTTIVIFPGSTATVTELGSYSIHIQ